MKLNAFFPTLLILLGLVQPLFSQNTSGTSSKELEEALRYLQDKALEVQIHARLIGKDRENVWNTESRKLTVSGKSISITLQGEDLTVSAHILPFLNEGGSIFLVAKGEVWVQQGPDEEKKYYSTVKSLPIKPGESVIFFPTGVLMDTEDNDVHTIELEIQVEPLE
ncbi:MAG: hypothetical protein K9M94_06705 [Spirochaetia bacterium]|nr:hypothetical protein [Spirochaetia bacterium]